MVINKETVIQTSIGAAIGVILAAVTATTFVNTRVHELEQVQQQLAGSQQRLSDIAERVQFLECREYAATATLQNIFADLEQILATLDVANVDFRLLERKMQWQFENQRAQLSDACGQN